jgi:hypothetical protein
VAHDVNAPACIPVRVRRRLLPLARKPGVGEEHVDRAVFGFGGCDQRLDVVFEAHVSGHSQSVNIARDLGKPIARGLEVSDHDAARASFRIGAGNRLADAARRARDHADFAFDMHVVAHFFS